MRNFFTIYQYEIRKICRKRINQLAVLILFIGISISVCAQLLGSYYVDGVKVDTHYHMFQVDSAYQRALNGRSLDQLLLEEMKAGYDRIPDDADRYTLTEEYQTYARPYSEIFNLVRINMGMTVSETFEWKADEEALYAGRQAYMEALWEEKDLSQGETAYWKEKDQLVKKPFTFYYKESYWTLMDCIYTVGILLLLLTAICLAGVFTEEHTRRTDQLLLCSRLGTCQLYWAKLAAGLSVITAVTILFTAAFFSLAFTLYGADGFSAAFQLMAGTYAYPLSVGQAVLIAYGMAVAAMILTGTFVMVLSEALRSNMGTLALVSGMVILTMFVNFPEQHRVLYQLWSYLPSNFLSEWGIFDSRLVPFFGTYLTAWQAVPALYLIITIVLAFLGKRIYQRYQVSGR